MNELKEQLEDTLIRVKEGRDIDFEMEICHGRTIEEGVDAIMQLIETYTTQKELEARIDELMTYTTNLPDVDSTEEWLKTRLAILSSQLTNNKKEQ